MIGERESIAIAELAIYSPLFVLALYVFARHGFFKQIGWLYVNIFCGLRIGGAAVTILSVHHPSSISDAAWAAILSSIGLSPLLLSLSGLLKRVNDYIEPGSFRVLAIRLNHIPCLLGLILGIVGGTDLEKASDRKKGLDFLKASGILFLVAYVVICAISALTFPYLQKINRSEMKILVAVLASLPFLAVRVLYGILADFVNKNDFSVLDPNLNTQLGMAVVMEMIVVIVYLVAGVIAEPSTEQQNGPPMQMANKHYQPGEVGYQQGQQV